MQDPLPTSQLQSPSSKHGRGKLILPRARSTSQQPYESALMNSGKAQVVVEGMPPQENLQLVPCRWSKSGWKYVQKDPSKFQYFNNPNRVNSFGFTQKKMAQAQQMQNTSKSVTKESEFTTSYGRFFNSSQ